MSVSAHFEGAKGVPGFDVVLVPEGKPLERIGGYIVVDGVACSAEVLRLLIVQPRPDRLLSIYRDGDHVEVTAHQRVLPSLEAAEHLALAHSLAYEFAVSVIETNCMVASRDGLQVWYDTRSAAEDVTDHVRYLQARGLLDVNGAVPHWVSPRDESEPMAGVSA